MGEGAGSRLIFLLKPPEEIASQVRERADLHCRRHGGSARAHPRELLHVSLLGLNAGPDPSEFVGPAGRAGASIRARPVEVAFDRTAVFGAGRHLALLGAGRNTELAELFAMVGRALRAENVPHRRGQGFTPHMTLVYGRKGLPLMSLDRPVVWTARELLLVRSHHGEGRHEALGRWPFDPRAPSYPVPPEQLTLDLASWSGPV